MPEAIDFGAMANAIEQVPVALTMRRASLGLSYRDVADATGLSLSELHKIEHDKVSVGAKNLIILGRWLAATS